MIDIFHSNFLENLEECGYPLTLKFIDILRQSSNGKRGGRESLFRIHRDNMEERDIVVLSVIVQLNKVESAMKIVGGKEFKYTKEGQGVMFMSELWNESLNAQEGTVKIALFYEGTTKLKTTVKEERRRVKERWDKEIRIIEDHKKSAKV